MNNLFGTQEHCGLADPSLYISLRRGDSDLLGPFACREQHPIITFFVLPGGRSCDRDRLVRKKRIEVISAIYFG
jgi:hypothetical protein